MKKIRYKRFFLFVVLVLLFVLSVFVVHFSVFAFKVNTPSMCIGVGVCICGFCICLLTILKENILLEHKTDINSVEENKEDV